MAFSEKFESLHAGEGAMREVSITAIEKSDDLLLHVRTLEAALDLIDHFSRVYETSDQNKLMIQLLGIRIFNATGAAMSLLLGGYYQNATMQGRDILETWFLLDYLGTDATLISSWRTLAEKDRRKNFAPVVVRKALDARDGFKGQRRAEHYRILSAYGAHPSPESFRLYRRTPDGLAIIGPFFDDNSLKALLEELAKLIVAVATTFGRLFVVRGRVDQLARVDFLDAQGRWTSRFLGTPYDAKEVAKFRATAMKYPEMLPDPPPASGSRRT